MALLVPKMTILSEGVRADLRWGNFARHNSLTKLKKTAYGAQMVSCGGSAKGGVSLQSKMG